MIDDTFNDDVKQVQICKSPKNRNIFETRVRIEETVVSDEPFYTAFVYLQDTEGLPREDWLISGASCLSKADAVSSAAMLLRGYAGSLDLLAHEIAKEEIK